MRAILLLALSLSCASICLAQAPAPAPAAADQQKIPAPSETAAIEKRTEHIRVEDAGARIDELRVGGETLSITVQPAGGMPAYQIAPTSGERSWKILGF